MKSIIIISNGASNQQIDTILSILPETERSRTLVIANTLPTTSINSKNFFPISGSDIGMSFIKALNHTDSSGAIILDARINLKSNNLMEIISNLEKVSAAGITFVPLNTGSQSYSLPEMNIDNIVTMLNHGGVMPFMAVAISPELIAELKEHSAQNMSELITKIMIQALAETMNVQAATNEIATDSKLLPNLDSATIASCLRTVIDCCNIEDLFPIHPWASHQTESAAACYHTLAAMFIKHEDAEAALDCLKLSDQLEDSPRSQALKGVIAMKRGETLAAVANMVSCLQQYEERKHNNGKHYLTFKPSNLEMISTNLNAGLEALNKRDNTSAISYFASAINSFDSFYNETGLAINN